MYPPRLSRPRYLQQTTGLCKAEKPHRSKEAKAPALFLRMDWVLVILNATIVENIYTSMDPYINNMNHCTMKDYEFKLSASKHIHI